MDETTISGDDDRLSTLPDDVLTTILSFLGANEVVQTCLLSKRWRNLWTLVPCLDFTDSTYKIDGEFKPGGLERFQNFVSSFLHLRDDATDLQTFRLWHIMSPDSMSWVRYAVMHNVQNLRLEFYGEECIDLPDCLFACESLQDVYLVLWYWDDDNMGLLYEEDCIFIVPDIVSLPKLKKLHLLWQSVEGDFMDKLFAGCPALESLTLDCDYMEMTNNISFRSLKRLYLYNHAPLSFCISAPCLEYLEYSGNMESAAKFKDMCNVKKAKFVIYIDMDGYNCELLSSFSCIEDLTIDSCCLLEEMSEVELPKCPTFHNLKNLTLEGCCMYCGFSQLSSYLKHCPNLEVLTLHTQTYHEGWGHDEEEIAENLEEIERFGCCDQLRLVNVVYADWDLHVDRLIRLLVRSTMGMEYVQINMRKYKRK